MTALDIPHLRELLAKATPRPWRAMRDGNQYVNATYLPTAKLVGASRIEGPRRPWNPHAYIAYGFKPTEFETVRFVDEDADLIAAAVNALPALLDEVERLRRVVESGKALVDSLVAEAELRRLV